MESRAEDEDPKWTRARYLEVLGEHAALASGLRAMRPRKRPAPPEDRPLRVVFLSAYPAGHYGTASRFTPWIPHLERQGVVAEILTPSTDAEFGAYGRGDADADIRFFRICVRNQWRNLRRAADADVVVLHRGLFPFSPWQRPTFERLLSRWHPHLVYDFYDAIWPARRRASQHPSRVARWLNPPDKIEQVIKLARVVTVANEPLAAFARPHHRDVRILPVLLEPGDFNPRRHEARAPVVLGWSGSGANVQRLRSLAPALQRLAATRNIVVRVASPEVVEIPGVHVVSDTRPWSPWLDREHLGALDIGLVPLDDTEVDRGKSPLKLLQYSAMGLAVVATPVAMDFEIMRPGDSFLPASSEDDWVGALTRLVDDVGLRQRLGAAARRVLVEHYSFERHLPAFMDILRTGAGRPAPPG